MNIAFMDSYTSFSCHLVIQPYLLCTDDKLLVDYSPYYLMWGV